MKENDGVGLAARMREINPDVKVVITTAFELIEEDLTAKLPDVGRSDILKKPFTQGQICKAVEKTIAVILIFGTSCDLAANSVKSPNHLPVSG